MAAPPTSIMEKLFCLFWTLLFIADHSVSANVADQIIHDIAEGAESVKNTVKQASHSAGDFLHHEADLILKNSALAGNVWPVVQKLVITPEKAKLIATKTMEVIHWQDLALIGFFGWCTVPLLKISTDASIRVTTNGNLDQSRKNNVYDSTAFYVADALSQIAKIALLVYGVDIFKIILTCMGFGFPHLNEMPHNFAKVAYILWLVKRICSAKSSWISQHFTQREALGHAKVMDRLIDAAILGVTTIFIFDILSVQLGFAGKSVFAIGSVGTLVVSLASQGFVTQILNGLLLASSDRIYEGDKVRFGKHGIGGTIVKMGWMETMIRGPDEIMVTVPNADLAGEHVSNLSRIHRSQVKQTLRFEYKDVDKLPLVVEDIKQEIQRACPQLISDGSRPFRVHFTGYGPDHCEVRVNAHFEIKPVGNEYWDNRQRVNLAIQKAVKKHDMEFAITQG